MRVRPRRSRQLDLFQPPPNRPHWTDLPPQTRQKVLALLTRLLRDTRRIPPSTPETAKEGSDE